MGPERNKRQLVVEVAKEHGFRTLNAAPHFYDYLAGDGTEADRKERNAFQIPRSGHPRALAHRLQADVLFDEVSEVLGPFR